MLSELTKQLVNIEQIRERREQQEKRRGKLIALLGLAKNLRNINPEDFVDDWENFRNPAQAASFILDLALESQNIKDDDTARSLKELKAVLDTNSTNTRPNFLDFYNKLKTVQDRIVWSITEWEEELEKLSLLT